jgi:hypothetical protein
MFRQVLAILAIGLVVSSDALAQQAPAHRAIVRTGTGLKLALLQPLDSATAKAGDDVPLRLSGPLVVNGVTLLGEGVVLHGKVTRVKRSGPRCRNGEVNWKLDRIPFSDGTTARSSVHFTAPEPDANVANQLDTGQINPFVWFFVVPIAGPFLVAFIVIASPVLLFNALFPDAFTSCTMPGKEFHLPANATVGVAIMKDHHVSY